MLINVYVNGQKLFDWACSSGDIARIDRDLASIANSHNLRPEELAESAVRRIVSKGGFFSTVPELEMVCVIYWLLEKPTNQPGRPGRWRDYIELWDFNFEISAIPGDPDKVLVVMRGDLKGGGTA